MRDTSIDGVSGMPAISAMGTFFLICFSRPPKTRVRQVSLERPSGNGHE